MLFQQEVVHGGRKLRCLPFCVDREKASSIIERFWEAKNSNRNWNEKREDFSFRMGQDIYVSQHVCSEVNSDAPTALDSTRIEYRVLSDSVVRSSWTCGWTNRQYAYYSLSLGGVFNPFSNSEHILDLQLLKGFLIWKPTHGRWGLLFEWNVSLRGIWSGVLTKEEAKTWVELPGIVRRDSLCRR